MRTRSSNGNKIRDPIFDSPAETDEVLGCIENLLRGKTGSTERAAATTRAGVRAPPGLPPFRELHHTEAARDLLSMRQQENGAALHEDDYATEEIEQMSEDENDFPLAFPIDQRLQHERYTATVREHREGDGPWRVVVKRRRRNKKVKKEKPPLP